LSESSVVVSEPKRSAPKTIFTPTTTETSKKFLIALP
jgi:hypothetical protein